MESNFFISNSFKTRLFSGELVRHKAANHPRPSRSFRTDQAVLFALWVGWNSTENSTEGSFLPWSCIVGFPWTRLTKLQLLLLACELHFRLRQMSEHSARKSGPLVFFIFFLKLFSEQIFWFWNHCKCSLPPIRAVPPGGSRCKYLCGNYISKYWYVDIPKYNPFESPHVDRLLGLWMRSKIYALSSVHGYNIVKRV